MKGKRNKKTRSLIGKGEKNRRIHLKAESYLPGFLLVGIWYGAKELGAFVCTLSQWDNRDFLLRIAQETVLLCGYKNRLEWE